MSEIIEEVPTLFPKISSDKKHILSKVQFKNAYACNTELLQEK